MQEFTEATAQEQASTQEVYSPLPNISGLRDVAVIYDDDAEILAYVDSLQSGLAEVGRSDLVEEIISMDPTESEMLDFLEEAVATESSAFESLGDHGHKGMDSTKPTYSPETVKVWLQSEGLEIYNDLGSGGAVVYNSATGLPVGFIKPPLFRPKMNDTRISESDIRPIYVHSKSDFSFQAMTVGSEVESIIYDPHTKDVDSRFMEDDSPAMERISNRRRSGVIGWEERYMGASPGRQPNDFNATPEFGKYMIETGAQVTADVVEAAVYALADAKTVARLAQDSGDFIDPSSVLRHREVREEDISNDEYVQRLVHHFLTEERIMHFVGAGTQFHTEILEPRAGMKWANYRTLISPWLTVISQCSPFIKGTTRPNLLRAYSDIADNEEYDHDDWHGTRFVTREVGSFTGAVPAKLFPDDPLEFFAEGNKALAESRTLTPIRLRGEHVTVRPRFDLGSPERGSYGTIEVCDYDNFGMRPETVAAALALEKALSWKVQMLVLAGREAELPSNLFPDYHQDGAFGVSRLQSLEVAKYGAAAEFIDESGHTYTAQDQIKQLIAWASQPLEASVNGTSYSFEGLHEATVSELNKATLILDDDFFDNYADGLFSEEFGDPETQVHRTRSGASVKVLSVKGFYETGFGTLSQWEKRRASDLRKAGKTQIDTVVTSMHHAAMEATKNLLRKKVKDVKAVFGVDA